MGIKILGAAQGQDRAPGPREVELGRFSKGRLGKSERSERKNDKTF
jgi:hypothetical protein